jgi:prepilin-type N-terminal cleavage/methylation domain-containing protein
MVMRKGFSLVEVTVAMLLLSLGMLGVAATGLLAARTLREAEAREAMVERAGSVLDSLVAHGGSGTGRIDDVRFQLEWSASATSVEVRTVMPDGSRFELRALR